MKKEIEVLIQVFSAKSEVESVLSRFKFLGTKETYDIYYFDPLRDDLKPQPNGHLRACFRLRQKQDSALLAYKVDYFNNKDVWQYSDEHETEVSDHQTAKKIIEHLGLKPLVEIKLKKHLYLDSDYEMAFEEVEGFGLFMEVELLKAPDDANVAEERKKIWEFIDKLGLKIGPELNVGKPEFILKQKNV